MRLHFVTQVPHLHLALFARLRWEPIATNTPLNEIALHNA